MCSARLRDITDDESHYGYLQVLGSNNRLQGVITGINRSTNGSLTFFPTKGL